MIVVDPHIDNSLTLQVAKFNLDQNTTFAFAANEHPLQPKLS